jgi:hypothetical protein
MPHVFLDWEDFSDYLKKGIFLYFEQFLPYLGFYGQKFEKWPFYEINFFFLK